MERLIPLFERSIAVKFLPGRIADDILEPFRQSDSYAEEKSRGGKRQALCAARLSIVGKSSVTWRICAIALQDGFGGTHEEPSECGIEANQDFSGTSPSAGFLSPRLLFDL
ncbi:hypothetical protein Q4I32_007984 [Leishmania shawi]|uniref:Uncharacterized protein n=1 Tax=Leishmania shawi TaxID=5680 RepID=A0AAW3B6T0_9TRYP